MGFVVAHPWVCAAVAVVAGFGVVAAILFWDEAAARRRAHRYGGYVVGGDR